MPEPDTEQCPRCEGTGKYQRLAEPERDCAVCNGTGMCPVPEPDLAALVAELQTALVSAKRDVRFRVHGDGHPMTVSIAFADRILAALKQAGEWKRLLDESDNYGAFCRMKQTVAELRQALEAVAIPRRNGPKCWCWLHSMEGECVDQPACRRAADLLARTAPLEEGK